MRQRDKLSETLRQALQGWMVERLYKYDVENDAPIDGADCVEKVAMILTLSEKYTRILEKMWRYEQLNAGASMTVEQIAEATCPKIGKCDERWIEHTRHYLKEMRSLRLVYPSLNYANENYYHVVGVGQELCEHVLGY